MIKLRSDVDWSKQVFVECEGMRQCGECNASTKTCSGFTSKVWLNRQCRCMSSKPEAVVRLLRNDDLL